MKKIEVRFYSPVTGSKDTDGKANRVQSLIRAQLFKTNNVIKILNVYILNLPIFFVEKIYEAFALQKLLLFFQQSNISVFG